MAFVNRLALVWLESSLATADCQLNTRFAGETLPDSRARRFLNLFQAIRLIPLRKKLGRNRVDNLDVAFANALLGPLQ